MPFAKIWQLDASGAVINQRTHTIDDALHYTHYGEKALVLPYSYGKLVSEERYNDEGSVVEEIEYLEDGSKTVSCYDDNGDPVASTTYAADGSIISEENYAAEEEE